MQASKALGVSYQHLWRVVISKERQSKKLTASFRKFKKTGAVAVATKKKYINSPKPPVPSVNIAAAENLSPEFFANLQKLGFELVIVRFQAGRDSDIWNHPGIETELDAALQLVKVGQHDSSAYETGAFFHFFHIWGTKCLGVAVKTLVRALDARGLLPITTILSGESHDSMRVYYPPHDPKNQVVRIPDDEEETGS